VHTSVGADALERVADRQPRYDAVPALRERREHSLDHLVGQEWPRGVVDEDDERVRRHLGKARTHRIAPRLAAGHASVHLAAALFLGDENRGLLPFCGCNDHDAVHPGTGLEPAQRLG